MLGEPKPKTRAKEEGCGKWEFRVMDNGFEEQDEVLRSSSGWLFENRHLERRAVDPVLCPSAGSTGTWPQARAMSRTWVGKARDRAEPQAVGRT